MIIVQLFIDRLLLLLLLLFSGISELTPNYFFKKPSDNLNIKKKLLKKSPAINLHLNLI